MHGRNSWIVELVGISVNGFDRILTKSLLSTVCVRPVCWSQNGGGVCGEFANKVYVVWLAVYQLNVIGLQ